MAYIPALFIYRDVQSLYMFCIYCIVVYKEIVVKHTAYLKNCNKQIA